MSWVVFLIPIQIACAVHVVRTGRPYFWLWVILFFSGLGCLIYFFAEILPDLGRNPAFGQAAHQAARHLDPARERRRIEQRLAVADTQKNRLDLAEECLRLGDYGNAVELFNSCLSGVFADDPVVRIGLARAQFGAGDYAAAQAGLALLQQNHADFQTDARALLQAQTAEALGQLDEAVQRYGELAETATGEEARGRYALLLKKLGRHGEARRVFERMLERARVAPSYYRRREGEWLRLARRELRNLPAT